MTDGTETRNAWLHGFATGVAVCTVAAYVRRKYGSRGPRIVHDDGTIIPID